MAFLLKSSKVIQSLVSFTCQRGLIGRRKLCFFLQNSSTFGFNQFRVRTTASLAAEYSKDRYHEDIEKSVAQLSVDIQNQRVFIENVKDVFEALKQKGEITYPQLIILLKSCSEVAFMSSSNERIQLAEEIWKTAADLGTKFTINHYNALIQLFVDNKHRFSPSEFLEVLKNEGIEPNLVTYKRILKAYCQQGNMEGADSVLRQMAKYPLSEDDFNSLILGYSEVGDIKKAEDILKVMEEKEMDATSKSYTYLLCGYAKNGQIEKLQDLLQELPKKDIFLSESQLLEIVYSLAVNKQTHHIDVILQNLKDTEDTDKSSVTRIIQRLLHCKLDSVAFKVYELLGKSAVTNQNLPETWQNILKHFVVHRSPQEVLKLCREMEEKGL